MQDNLEAVKKCLDRGADTEKGAVSYSSTLYTGTPLMLAAQRQGHWLSPEEAEANAQIIQLLLDAGCNIRPIHPNTGKTALGSAIEARNTKAIELLTEAGAMAKDSDSWTYAFETLRNWAQGKKEQKVSPERQLRSDFLKGIYESDYSAVQAAIKNGVDVDMILYEKVSENGEEYYKSPLELAFFSSDIRIFNLLINAGADINGSEDQMGGYKTETPFGRILQKFMLYSYSLEAIQEWGMAPEVAKQKMHATLGATAKGFSFEDRMYVLFQSGPRCLPSSAENCEALLALAKKMADERNAWTTTLKNAWNWAFGDSKDL